MRGIKLLTIFIVIIIFTVGSTLFYRHYIDLRKTLVDYKSNLICNQCTSGEPTPGSVALCAEVYESELREIQDNPANNKDDKVSTQKRYAVVDPFLGLDYIRCTITFEGEEIVEARSIGPEL